VCLAIVYQNGRSFSNSAVSNTARKPYTAMATDSKTYKFNHSMIRVKDPKASVKFYEHLGMKVIQKIEQPEAKFDLYFLGYDSPKAVSGGNHFTDREGLIELTHNYGTENDENYKVSTGNEEPHKGFGHTCISVDNIQAACQRIEDAGYKFKKKLTDGRMRHIAFVLDPDDYWVEVVSMNPIEATEHIKTTDLETYRMVKIPFVYGELLLILLEPYHDPCQGPSNIAEVLPRCYGHGTVTHERKPRQQVQPLLPRL
jgi:lactoylglutathione lyase